jgi:hypothetical protein
MRDQKKKKKVWPGGETFVGFLAVEKTPLGHAHAVLSFMQPIYLKKLMTQIDPFSSTTTTPPPPSPPNKNKKENEKNKRDKTTHLLPQKRGTRFFHKSQTESIVHCIAIYYTFPFIY